jgi:hypothetical protein
VPVLDRNALPPPTPFPASLPGGFYVTNIPVWIGWIKWLSFLTFAYNLILKVRRRAL